MKGIKGAKEVKRKRREDFFVVIMAGGRGERFWPLSREKTPKQLLALIGSRSFLQQAVDRVEPIVPPENIFVVTNSSQLAQVRKQCPQLPSANLVAEPCGRDTCAAVALGAALVGARSSAGVMAVLPSDHVIGDNRRFQCILRDSMMLAAQEPVLVTIGIQPTEPATGYGYIRMGPSRPPIAGNTTKSTRFYEAEKFVEKPNLERAAEYVNSGQYRWNAGMFIWSFPTIQQVLNKHQPGLAALCERWRSLPRARLAAALARDYPALTKISVDYALMEKAENVVVADGDFPWDDLGAWPALLRHLPADADGNCAVGQLLQVNATGNLVFDARTRNRGLTTLVGLRDSIVVLTDDATLVATRDQAQAIKELVRQLATVQRFKNLI